MLGIVRRSGTRQALAASLALSGFTADAAAHIDLLTPAPREHGPSREPNSNVKSGPCGQEVNGRTDRVTVLAPGDTVEVTWVETTNHRSYYRVAFDVDGDDAFPMFLGDGRDTEGIDPRGLCPVDGQVILAYDLDDRSGGSHTLSVRLPDVECERCTLQVIQYMHDARSPYYFQCADLALRRPQNAEAPADGDALDAGLRDAAPTSSALDAASPAPQQNASAAPGCSSRIAPDPPASDDDDEDEDDESSPPPAARPQPSDSASGGARSPVEPRSDGGCSIPARRQRGWRAAPWLSLIAAGALSRALLRRRRSSRARALDRGTRRTGRSAEPLAGWGDLRNRRS